MCIFGFIVMYGVEYMYVHVCMYLAWQCVVISSAIAIGRKPLSLCIPTSNPISSLVEILASWKRGVGRVGVGTCT